MGIDKTTAPNYINIVIDNVPAYINQLAEQAEADVQNEEGGKKLSLTNDGHSFEPSEYYLDESDNSILISGKYVSSKGGTWITISMPLSDIVLIDILQYAIKKLNKLKTAMETLK